MYSGRSVVKHGIYQLPLSKGLAESHRSAVHQHAALLSHLTVTALRPVRRGEDSHVKVKAPQDYKRSHNLYTHQMLESSSPTRLESKSSRSTA